jgi:hypothetical protein
MVRTPEWRRVEIETQLAGISRDGSLARFFVGPVPELFVPGDIELADGEGGQVLLLSGRRQEPDTYRMDKRGVLPAFARLAEASADGVLRFARKWGLLNLCECGLPASHNPHPYPPIRAGIDPSCWPTYVEPVAVWQQFARQARAILAIAGCLHQGRVGRPEDWAVVYEVSGRQAPWWDQIPDLEQDILARVVGEWLRLGNVRPELRWEVEGRVEVILSHAGLFGAVTRELAFAVANISGLATCAGCGTAFAPTRQPAKGQRSWCSECRASGADLRQAKRDQRARYRATRRD